MIEKKIGIITFHAADNFGSALQAYALEKVLQSLEYEPEIINIIYAKDMEQYKVFRIQRTSKSYLRGYFIFDTQYKEKTGISKVSGYVLKNFKKNILCLRR